MLVDFMCSKYIQKIECDKPQRDDYHVENLISESNCDDINLKRSQNGFISDTFIRPPVNIKIFFKEPIKLDKIIFNSKVNSQVSNGFIILTSIDADTGFRQIARFINENNKTCFNYEFKRRSQISNETPNNKDVNLQYFIATYISYLNNVNAINISITRTQNSTSPCIRSLKVLGYSAGSVSSNQFCTNLVPSSFDEENILKINPLPVKSSKSVEIPNEFLDELTHELMRLPIRLPSGHVIDKSSLDKYLNEQSQANVQKSVDPFTRVEFSASYKPIIDAQLKAKIDQFLLNRKISDSKEQLNVSPCDSSVLVHSSRKRKIEEVSDNRYHEVFENLIKPKQNTDNRCEELNTEKNNKHFKADTKLITCACCFNKSSLNLYEINSCKHIYCRHCILKIKNVCLICKNNFKNSDVISLKFINNKIN